MHLRHLLAFVGVFVVQSWAHAQLPADKALKTFKVSNGLELTLWAAEPLCVNPTCMDIDHKGRVWYCESINYRQKLRGENAMRRPEGDRIVILEDTKGEGKADKATVFYQAKEIHAPLGIAILPYPDGKGQKVLVCQSPDILIFEDKDGDLKADGPPTKLLTGFRGLDHDHGVHGIIVGPDNKLYFTVGDAGVEKLQSSDGKGRKWTSNSTDCRAGTVWRCDLDGKNLELVAHNFRNNYEPCVDSFGTIFLSDNDDDGLDQTRICYVMPGGNYGYHRNPKTSHWNEEHPGIVPKILRTYRGSPTGICMYEGTLLPKEYRGQILHTDAGPGRLCCYHLKPKGAGYAVEREDVVTSTDSWFRPSDVTVAPDGAVFVCDWYDPGVGGHGVGDFTRGRIYRVAPQGNKPSVPTVDLKKEDGVLEAFGSPNLAVRYLAATQLQTGEWNTAGDVIVQALRQRGNPALRARACWFMGRAFAHTDKAFGFFDHTSKDADARFRALTVRSLYDLDASVAIGPDAPQRQELKEIASRALAGVIEMLLEKNQSSAVSRDILLALRASDPTDSRNSILRLAKQYDGKDRFFLAAVGIAVGHPGISKEIDARHEIILADFDKHFPEWNDKVAGLVWELRPPGMIAMLEKQLAKPLAASQRLQIVDILAGSADAKAGQLLLQTLAREKSPDVRDSILAYLQRELPGRWGHLRQSPELDRIIEQLMEESSQWRVALALIATSQKKDYLPKVLELAQHWNDFSETRKAAIQALGAFPDEQATLMLGLLFQQTKKPLPEALKAEVIAALSKQDTAKARTMLSNLATEEISLPLRQAAIAGLAGSKDGAGFLLKAYTDKRLPGELTPDLSRLLRNSPFPDVRKQAEAMLPAPPKLDPKKLPSITALAARRGNIVRGEEILNRTLKNDAACLKCHVVQGVGGNAGPDLSSIGAKASRENLLESILYPSKAINHQYDTWIVETNDGLVITGIIAQQTPEMLILRDANVKEYKLSLKDITGKKKTIKSIMPDDLLLHMGEEDLLDLVEYLYSLKSPPIAPTSWRREERPREIARQSPFSIITARS